MPPEGYQVSKKDGSAWERDICRKSTGFRLFLVNEPMIALKSRSNILAADMHRKPSAMRVTRSTLSGYLHPIFVRKNLDI